VEYLARKIDPGKWETKSYLKPQHIRADAITGGCLRTDSDKLSLWRCAKGPEDVSEVVLAVSANDRIRTVEGIYIVLFEANELTLEKFKIKDTPNHAQTVVSDLRDRHVDVVELHMNKVVELAHKVADKVRHGTDLLFFTRAQVLKIFRGAIQDKRLNLKLLSSLKVGEKTEIEQGI